MREIKIICRRKGYEVAPHRVVQARVMTEKGTIETIPVTIFDKSPAGNWNFTKTNKGYSEFTFRESLDWKYTGPSEVPEHIKKMSPGIGVRHGDPSCEYVTIEDAVMEFLTDLKGEIKQGEFALVATQSNADAIKYLIDNGWPEERVENIGIVLKAAKKEEAPVEEAPVEEAPVEEAPANPEPEEEEINLDFGLGNTEELENDN